MVNEWQPIVTAPYDQTVRVRFEEDDDFGPEEYYAFKRKRSCTGSCTPPGVREHSPHMHDEWLICTKSGEELHPQDAYHVIYPNEWRRLINYAENNSL